MAGIALSSIVGSIFAVDALDFVFRYLFLGTNLLLASSLVYHKVRGNKHRLSPADNVWASDLKEKPNCLPISDHRYELAI